MNWFIFIVEKSLVSHGSGSGLLLCGVVMFAKLFMVLNSSLTWESQYIGFMKDS